MSIEEIDRRTRLVGKYTSSIRYSASKSLDLGGVEMDPLDCDNFKQGPEVFGIPIPIDIANEIKVKVRDYYLNRATELKSEIDALP